MSPDDKRHGTVAGAQAHRRAGQRPCHDCQQAKQQHERDRPKAKRPKTNYIDSGYDPRDGLTGGRWMRDTWGVVRWVQTDGELEREDVRNRQCHECGVGVGPRFRYCGPCGLERERASKRAHMREVRAA